MKFKCNTYIILGYLHPPWNLQGYYIALPKPISNIRTAPYCDNILNYGINKGIVKLVTLMVKCIETIIEMRVLQLHIKTLLKWPYTINVANIAIPSCTYNNKFALVHWTIFIIYEFENIFQLYLMFT
jgi:hypothetical protein